MHIVLGTFLRKFLEENSLKYPNERIITFYYLKITLINRLTNINIF